MTTIPVMMSAQHVAMRARLGELEQLDVDDMLTRAEELLDHGADLYRAITGFATQFQMARHDAGALAMQGRILQEAVDAAAGLSPAPRPERRDVDG